MSELPYRQISGARHPRFRRAQQHPARPPQRRRPKLRPQGRPHRRARRTRSFWNRPQHEFRVASMLDHKNLIKVYALETVKDWLFRVRKVHLLIEYVNGKTLDTCPPSAAAPGAGLQVRGRRPRPHAPPKGLSRRPEAEQHPAQPSRRREDHRLRPGAIQGEGKNRIQGTPEYMAPEQVKQSHGQRAHRHLQFRRDHVSHGDVPSAAQRASSRRAACPSTAKMWRRMLKPVLECNPRRAAGAGAN